MSPAAAPATGDDKASGRTLSPRSRAALLLLALIALGWLAYTWAPAGSNPSGQPDDVESEGGANTGDSGHVVVNQTSVVDGLAPARPAEQLEGTFSNPSPAPVYVRWVTAAVTGTDRPGCSADDFIIAGSPAPVGAQIAPGLDQGSWSGLTIRLRNRPVNQDACKNTHVTIEYSAH